MSPALAGRFFTTNATWEAPLCWANPSWLYYLQPRVLTSSPFRQPNRHSTSSMVFAAAAAAKLLQSCPTLCNPIDGSPPGSPVPGSLQARTMEWVAISFSNAWKWKGKVKSLSHVQLLATPWTATYQTPLSMGFPRQEYWSGVYLLPIQLSTLTPRLENTWVVKARSVGSTLKSMLSLFRKLSNCIFS